MTPYSSFYGKHYSAARNPDYGKNDLDHELQITDQKWSRLRIIIKILIVIIDPVKWSESFIFFLRIIFL